MKNWICYEGEWFNLRHFDNIYLNETTEGFYLMGRYSKGGFSRLSKTFETKKEGEDFACAMLMWRE